MGAVYAEVGDVEKLRTLTEQQLEQAQELIESACAKLRITARQYGCDIDDMIAADADFLTAVKSVIVQAVLRSLSCLSDSFPPAVQASQSGMGYSASMTFLNSGQNLYFLNNELKELGIIRQRYGVMEFYGEHDQGCADNSL